MDGYIEYLGGITRTSNLLEAGWSAHSIRRALAAGRIQRPRVGWVALPTCDPQLRAAVAHGVVISCVTQAKRDGLWSQGEQRPHCAVPRPGAESRNAGIVRHYRTPIVPRERWAIEDRIENVLDLVAHCRPYEQAVAVWDSALRLGRVRLEHLMQLPFTGRAKDVLDQATPYADSGLESLVRMRLRRLGPELYPQAWVEGHQVDFLIGQRLILQIDGGHHVGNQRNIDNAHDARLQLLGYTVIRIGYAQVMSNWHDTHELLMRAVALGRHRA